MRLPSSAHTSHPWRIHEIAEDFRVLDVWALPTPGGPDDFPLLVELAGAADPSRSSSAIVRFLFEVRWKLGGLLGWDKPDAGVGSRVRSLRERLPEDLRAAAPGPQFEAAPFTPVYATDDEFAAEVANKTVHGILHLGWVADESGGYRGQMAVLVKPNGLFGELYLLGIMPFRHLVVYPALVREIESTWRAAYPKPVSR